MRPLLHIPLFCLLTLLPLLAVTQQGNTWYFGFASGFNFNPPIPLPYTTLPYPNVSGGMTADEGSSVMCNQDGNMIIYSNGATIYNNTQKPMVGGSSLSGSKSSFQSSIIVPMPGNDNLYYVFASDAIENSLLRGYTYSIVDITRDNGRGEVITRNVPMQAPGTERLTAAKHANGIDVWILTNDMYSNTYRAWLLTCNGLNPNPVVSNSGAVLGGFMRINVGVLKVSPDGKKLCHTHFDEGDGLPVNDFFQVFDFDNSTGVVSNPKQIDFFDRRLYVGEFSPDSKLLYITDPIRAHIMQFEATLPTAAAIKASMVEVPAQTGFFGMQNGPDGRIYLARFSFDVSFIAKPNVKGIGCMFTPDSIHVNAYCNIAMPQFINTAFGGDPNNGFTYQILDSCTGRVQFNGFSGLPGNIQWQWDFGDGNTSNQQNPQHSYANPKKRYQVKLRISSPLVCAAIQAQKDIIPAGIVADIDFAFEALCGQGLVQMVNKSVIDPPDAGNFTWFFGDGQSVTDVSPQHQYAVPGSYDVKLRFNARPACLSDSLTQTFTNIPLAITASPDSVTIDENNPVMLSVTGNANSYRWYPPDFLSDTTSTHPLANPFEDTWYKVTARNTSGCVITDSVLVKVNPLKDIFVPTAFSPNRDGVNDVFTPVLSRRTRLHLFAVYNRWGQPLYSTRSVVTIGWDGTFKGLPAEAGVYTWQLVAFDKAGKRMVRKGTVVLLR